MNLEFVLGMAAAGAPVHVATPVAEVPYWTYLIPIAVAFIAMVQTVLVAYFGRAVKQSVAATEKSAAATAVSVEKVHVAVNSERKVMVDEIRKLNATILEMSKDKATSDQVKRDKEK